MGVMEMNVDGRRRRGRPRTRWKTDNKVEDRLNEDFIEQNFEDEQAMDRDLWRRAEMRPHENGKRRQNKRKMGLAIIGKLRPTKALIQ